MWQRGYSLLNINCTKKRQRGAVSIEFAFMFVIIFILFYGLIGYSIPLLLGATYQQLAADGLREAVRSSSIYSLDMNKNDELNRNMFTNYQDNVKMVITESWLPDKWAQTCAGYDENYLKVADNQWSVCISNPEVKKILPAFKIFSWEIPSLPEEIKGEAKLRIR